MSDKHEASGSNSDQETFTMTRRATRTPALHEIEARLKELQVMALKKLPQRAKGDSISICHTCQGSFENKYVLRCGFSDCQETFCLLCAVEVFKKIPAFVYLAFKEGKWNCFICSGQCLCKKCEQENDFKSDEKATKTPDERSKEFEAPKASINRRNKRRSAESKDPSNKEIKAEIASENPDSMSLIGNLKLIKNKIVPKPNYPLRKIKMKTVIQEQLARLSGKTSKRRGNFSEEDTSDEERSDDTNEEPSAFESIGCSKFLDRKKRLWKLAGPVNNQLS